MPEYSTHSIRSFMYESTSDEIQVKSDAAEVLNTFLEEYIHSVVSHGWKKAQEKSRRTIMPRDIDVQQIPDKETLSLPLAPMSRIAKSAIDAEFSISKNTKLALVNITEEYIDTVCMASETIITHNDRERIQKKDIELYFKLFE